MKRTEQTIKNQTDYEEYQQTRKEVNKPVKDTKQKSRWNVNCKRNN